MEKVQSKYFKNIADSTESVWSGLKLTLKHLWRARNSRQPISVTNPNYFQSTEGINTVQFPHVMQPIPDNGRYRLHNEIDDCIVCDKCAKICPVNCITIEPVKAVEEIGKTSDGTSKRIYAAKFDIDMGKCCFCGLCTTVCPTECLTMTKVYDFSVFDMKEHNFAFAEMSEEEIAQRKKELEELNKSKAAAKAVTAPPAVSSTEVTPPAEAPKPAGAKPIFRPKIKPAGPPPTS
jgi:formate hydrogenlyase subunit 6/NADH:ubiquinone oxidoreductase subunit I